MPESTAACPNCGHALAKTNRGWWWCSRCERRMRLKDSVGGSALLTSGVARPASLTPTDTAASPSFWPGNVPGGVPGHTDHEEIGPIGAGTPHARMQWFWGRMEPHEKLIEELTGWSPFSSNYRFEAAVADAFDKLAEAHRGE